MKMIDDEILAFCKNPQESIFWIPRECGGGSLPTFSFNEQADVGSPDDQYGFVKVPFADDMIGLYSVNHSLFETTANTNCYRLHDLNYCGFYHKKTGKIYLRFRETLRDTFPLNFHYENTPETRMCVALSDELTKRVAADVDTQSITSMVDINDPCCYLMARLAYRTEGENYKAHIPYDIFLRDEHIRKNIEVSKFLTNPEKWVEETANALEDDPKVYAHMREIMSQQLRTQFICQAIAKDPNHIMNKVNEIVDLLKGKTSVILRFQNGNETCDVRYPVEKLDFFGSSFHYCDKKSRDDAARIIGKKGFWFEDISAILYKGKVLYKKTT